MKKPSKFTVGASLFVALVLILTIINPNDENNKNSNTSDVSTKEVSQTKEDNVKTDDEKSSDNDKSKKSKINENADTIEYNGEFYNIIDVDGGKLSGYREANVAVDIGFGDRIYWGLTNEHGQLVYVLADEIILQDDNKEPVNKDGRYYDDEAKVPGTEREDLDEGHVIADSLGGVSNAYNITPQNSTLNRHGNQAYMEKVIRDAGGCENFVAIITYPNTTTQIPSNYYYEYVLKGEEIVEDFDYVNPDEVNNKEENVVKEVEPTKAQENELHNLSSVDTNGNGKVTIAEAKAAGYSMPIYSDHWLYQYMDDRDGDGMVGE